jgi:hypothetical protein
VASPWIVSSRVIVPNAPPATTARPSRVRRPRAMSATLAAAATDAPTAMNQRCPVPLIGASPSRIRKCTPAAGTTALAAISRRFEPKRLRRILSIPAGLSDVCPQP